MATAQQMFRHAWAILDVAEPTSVASCACIPQLWDANVGNHRTVCYRDTVVSIYRGFAGGMPSLVICIPHENPDMVYNVLSAGMPTRSRKNVLGIVEITHGFTVERFIPGPWCTHIATLGNRANRVLKTRQARDDASSVG